VTTADGLTLRGWLLIPPRWNGDALMMLHGFTDTRAYLLDHARMFLDEGFATLMPDNRGHGESDDAVVSFGVRERHDVRQWGDWLCERLKLERYYLFGQSMGAAIGMLALPLDTRIAGYVSEACFTHFAEAALRRLIDRHFFGQQWAAALFLPVLGYGYLYGRARYGTDLRQSAPEAVMPGLRIPVLLIHGTADRTIPPDSIHALHALNPGWTETFVVEGAGHTECFARGGDEYKRRVTGFLSRIRD
jgi:pimeloyl-ACP methyl ester carboxylesterase